MKKIINRIQYLAKTFNCSLDSLIYDNYLQEVSKIPTISLSLCILPQGNKLLNYIYGKYKNEANGMNILICQELLNSILNIYNAMLASYIYYGYLIQSYTIRINYSENPFYEYSLPNLNEIIHLNDSVDQIETFLTKESRSFPSFFSEQMRREIIYTSCMLYILHEYIPDLYKICLAESNNGKLKY